MDKLPPPGHLNINGENLSQAWKTWKQQFELVLAATKSDTKSDKIKLSILLTYIGNREHEIYNTFEYETQ